MSKKYLRTQGVADRYGVHYRSVPRMVADKRISTVRRRRSLPRADFQHPAFRLTLPYDPRRASIVRAHKMQDRKFSKHIAKGEP